MWYYCQIILPLVFISISLIIKQLLEHEEQIDTKYRNSSTNSFKSDWDNEDLLTKDIDSIHSPSQSFMKIFIMPIRFSSLLPASVISELCLPKNQFPSHTCNKKSWYFNFLYLSKVTSFFPLVFPSLTRFLHSSFMLLKL